MEVPGVICTKCGWSDYYNAETCPRCNVPVKQSSFRGHGKIVTFTIIRYPPRGFEKDVPFVVGIIDLENGPRVIARIKANPENVPMEAPVRLIQNSNGLLQFEME